MLPIKLKIITLGKTSREYKPLLRHYMDRISSLSHARFISGGKIPPGAILLDPAGEEIDGEDFFRIIQDGYRNGREVVFVVGPPEGFGEVKGYRKISLSKLTFQHDLAHLILLEQVYRALLRLKGTRYEK